MHRISLEQAQMASHHAVAYDSENYSTRKGPGSECAGLDEVIPSTFDFGMLSNFNPGEVRNCSNPLQQQSSDSGNQRSYTSLCSPLQQLSPDSSSQNCYTTMRTPIQQLSPDSNSRASSGYGSDGSEYSMSSHRSSPTFPSGNNHPYNQPGQFSNDAYQGYQTDYHYDIHGSEHPQYSQISGNMDYGGFQGNFNGEFKGNFNEEFKQVSEKPKRKRVLNKGQRSAANMRERKRMVSLNDAFDLLKKNVPTFAYEKKLSRIETLRLAVSYISFMSDILDGKDPKDIHVADPSASS